MAKYVGENALTELVTKIKTELSGKQATLTAGTNISIETINNALTISAEGVTKITSSTNLWDLKRGVYFGKLKYMNYTSNTPLVSISEIEGLLICEEGVLGENSYCLAIDVGGKIYKIEARASSSQASLATVNWENLLSIGNKVDKTANAKKIYATSSGSLPTQTTLDYGTSATADYIVQRITGGQITVPQTPSNNTDATSKSYVDTGLSGKQDTLTFDTTPTSASTNPVTSGGVYTALGNKVDKVTGKGLSTDDFVSSDYYTKTQIDGIVSSVYKPSGSVAFANLPTLSASVLGNVYNMSDSFTIDNRFVEYDSQTTKSYPAGTNVVVVDIGSSTYKFDVLAGMVDLSGYVPTSRTINGKALTSNITLSASDVGALPSNTTYVSSVNGSSGAITGIQTTGNLVTSFSSTTSDSKYPSEKLVKTSLDAKQDTMTELTDTEVDAIWDGD